MTSFAFPATVASGSASALFLIRNDNDATLPSIATTLDGDSGFTIDATMSTCMGGQDLVSHDLCTVFVRWTAAMSDASTQLVVTSGSATSRLPIQGPVGASGHVVVDTSAIDFGIVPIGGAAMTVGVRLTNTGTTNVVFEPPTQSFVLGDTDCQYGSVDSHILVAGRSCTVVLGFRPSVAGWVAEAFGVGDATVSLDAYGVRGIAVEKHGTGTGRISSIPSGIDCGTDCSTQSAYVINDATLTETPDDGTSFAGWSSICGTDPTCVVPERSTGGVIATFAGPGSAALAFTMTGTGSGQIALGNFVPPLGAFEALTLCTHSCTTYAPVGSSLEVYALTPSRFDGWTGNCTGADAHCTLPIVGDAAANATFDKDDREVVTLLPEVGFPPQAIAFALDGDLVIAGNDSVAKLGLDGTVRWSTGPATNSHVADLGIDSNGDIDTLVFGFEGNATVTTRSATGVILSSGQARPPSCTDGTFTFPGNPQFLHSPNGDSGIFGGFVLDDGQLTNMLTIVGADGTLKFQVDLGTSCATSVAVGPDGVYQVLDGDQPGLVATSYHVLRYDASGNALATSGPYTMSGYRGSVAIDGSGALAFHIAVGDSATVPGTTMIGRILLDGTSAFTSTTTGYFGDPTGIAYDPAGNVIVASALSGAVDGGLDLEQRSSTGGVLWTLEKSPDGPSSFPPVFQVNGVTTSTTGQVAVAGSYSPFTDGPVPWIAVYQMH